MSARDRAGREPATVVLLHGMGRTSASMLPAALAARRRGLHVINWDYPTRRLSVAQHAERLRERIRAAEPGLEGKVHFLGHSLGGIVVRRMLADAPLERAGRLVMLGPPNAGSEVADKLRDWSFYRLVTGVVGQELGTDAASAVRALPPPCCEVGVIAGAWSTSAYVSRWVPEPSDGLVSVASASACEGASLLVVPCSHTFLPWHPRVLRQAFAFLETGRFLDR